MHLLIVTATRVDRTNQAWSQIIQTTIEMAQHINGHYYQTLIHFLPYSASMVPKSPTSNAGNNTLLFSTVKYPAASVQILQFA